MLSLALAVSCGSPSDEPTNPRTPTTEHQDNTGSDEGSDPGSGDAGSSGESGGTSGGTSGGEQEEPPAEEFTIAITAPVTAGYAGQTIPLTAVTSHPATVTWHSSDTRVARIDMNGNVTLMAGEADATAVVTASAQGKQATIDLTCHTWHLATWQGTAWERTGDNAIAVQRGATLRLRAVDAHGNTLPTDIALSQQWTATVVTPTGSTDATTVINSTSPPTQSNDMEFQLLLRHDAPRATTIHVTTTLGAARRLVTITII
jgi:hypothetical protein